MDEKRQVQEALEWLCDAISPATLRSKVVLPNKSIVEAYEPSCYLPASREETMEEVARFFCHRFHQLYPSVTVAYPLWLAQRDASEAVWETFSSGPMHRLRERGAHRIAVDEGTPALIGMLSETIMEKEFRWYITSYVLPPVQELPVRCRYGLAEAFQRALPKPPGVEFDHWAIFEIDFEDAIWHQARFALTSGGPTR